MFGSNGHRIIAVLLFLTVASGIALPDSLWVMDMSSCRAAHRFPASGGSSDLSLNITGIPENCAVAVAWGSGRLWALGPMGCSAVSAVDPATGETTSVITIAEGVCGTALTYGGGSLWVACDNSSVARIEPATGLVIGTTPTAVSSQITCMASDGTRLWVLENAYSERISELNPLSGAVVRSLQLTGFGAISALTWGGGCLWVTGSRTVSKVNPADGSIVGAVDLGSGWPITMMAYQEDSSGPVRMTVSQARTAPTGTEVLLESVAATARFADHAYVECGSRSGGIRVIGASLPERGKAFDIEGTIEVDSGEKAVRISQMRPLEQKQLEPLGMPVRSAALYGLNSGALHAPGAAGLCVTGLLVRTWGRVTMTGLGWFSISGGPGEAGIRVLCDSLTPPAQDRLVEITGISALFREGDAWLPALHVRDAYDLRILD